MSHADGRPPESNSLRPWTGRFLAACALSAGMAAAWAAGGVQQHVAAADARFEGQKPVLERPLQGFAPEGARVVAWGHRGAIEKISVEGLGERGRTLLDFYWHAGHLIAAHSRRIDYGAAITELPKDKPAPTTVVEEDWVEFAGDRVLRTRHRERDQPGGRVPAARVAELRANARSFLRLVKARGPADRASTCFWSCTRERRGECLRYACE